MALAPELAPLIKDLIARDKVQVPPFPGVAMRLRRLVDGGKYGIADLAKVVSEDQALAAGVLRAANSAALRGLSQVTNIKDAIMRLGSEELCRVALAVGLGPLASADGPLGELRRAAWRQGLVSALVCRQLAPGRSLQPDEAFTCGLLHDFGRLVAVAAIESLITGRPADWDRTEAQWMTVVDAFHLELGSLVAARWQLSVQLQEAIVHHHQPESAEHHRPMVELVAVSEAVAMLLERSSAVSAGELATVPGLRAPAEIDGMTKLLPMIPRFLMSIDEAVPSGKAPTPSRVAGDGSPEDGRRDVQLQGAWVRPSGDLKVEVTAVAAAGLVVKCPQKMRTQSLVWVRVDMPAGNPLEVCARVMSCDAEGAQHVCELRLYAVPPEVQQAWAALHAPS